MEKISLSIPKNQKRVTAFVIDDIIVSIFFVIIFYDQFIGVFSQFDVVDEAAIATINSFIADKAIIFLMIKVIYHTVLVWQNGVTIGKHFMKIKVVDIETGATPDLPKAFLRALIRIPSEILFYLGFLLAFFVPLKQTFHDRLSHCVVVDG